jgi:hypothetical protein
MIGRNRGAHRMRPPLLRARAIALAELMGLLAMPVAIYFALRVAPFSLASGLDSFTYLGYSQNASDLVTRYRLTYQAVRFGLVLPEHVAFRLFGPVRGHFALRYVLAVLIAGVLYLLARRQGSRAAGWVGAIVSLSSPILLRALMANYADTTGLPFLLIGVACLLMPSSRRSHWAFASGIAFGLAVHSHIFVLAVLAAVIPARIALQLLRREFSSLFEYVVVSAGILLVTALGALYYWRVFGEANLFNPTIAFIRANSSATLAHDYRAPTLAWFGCRELLFHSGTRPQRLLPRVPLVRVLPVCLLGNRTHPSDGRAGHEARRWRPRGVAGGCGRGRATDRQECHIPSPGILGVAGGAVDDCRDRRVPSRSRRNDVLLRLAR